MSTPAIVDGAPTTSRTDGQATWARRVAVFALAGIVGAVGGCGGQEFARVKVAPEQQLAVNGDLAAGKTLRLPADKALNIHDALRTSSGRAKADSDATETGTAFCSAEARDGGKASAEFQLGACLYNGSGKELIATVTFRIAYEHRAQSTHLAAAETAGKVLLKLFIRDAVGRIVKEQVLASSSSRTGPRSWSGRETQTFDVRLQPDLAYHVVLAGRVQAAAEAQTSARARIDIKKLELEIACRQPDQANRPDDAKPTSRGAS